MELLAARMVLGLTHSSVFCSPAWLQRRSCHVFASCLSPRAQQVTAHFTWDGIPGATGDLCLRSSSGEPEDAAVDCSPEENGDASTKTGMSLSCFTHACRQTGTAPPVDFSSSTDSLLCLTFGSPMATGAHLGCLDDKRVYRKL